LGRKSPGTGRFQKKKERKDPHKGKTPEIEKGLLKEKGLFPQERGGVARD